jgi:phosphotransferase system HPr (HPr) family protein
MLFMVETGEFIVTNSVGIHARPAATFVKKVTGFKSKITIENLSKKSQPVNAKSFLSLLSIDIRRDDQIRITADGEDAKQAIDELRSLIESKFGEAE